MQRYGNFHVANILKQLTQNIERAMSSLYFPIMATVLTIITVSELIRDDCYSGSGTGGPCPSSDLWMFDRTSKDWTSMDGHCARPR